MRKVAAIAAVLMLILGSCGGSDSFKVSGVIEGADDASVVVEKADYNGLWQPIDSTRTKGDGKFDIKVAHAGVPEIYRLVVDGKYIYFPVDSTEHVEVTTSVAGFGHDYTLAGSNQAVAFAEFDKSLTKLKLSDAAAVDKFKRDVFNRYIKDGRGNLISYYVLTKTVNGRLLFDPADPADVKFYSAVANIFKQFNPDDPRTKVLEQMAIEGMKKRNAAMGKQVVLNANELRVIEIDLPGIAGSNVKLSETMTSGRPTVVAFTTIQDPNNPQLLMRLRELYQNRGGNLTIYHVNVNGDRYTWRDGARNLPWTSVYAESSIDGKILRDYNVSEVPTFFVYNAAGELVDRAENYEGLAAILQAY